jgi:hypothetical protein
MPINADASPTKEFFVHTITKDVTVLECILDLIDNCLDGARNHLYRSGQIDEAAEAVNYEGFWCNVSISKETFIIEDNCGGISIDKAKNYAFRFGRRKNYEGDAGHSIGLYGIGMKRAILKLGRQISICSSTDDEAFRIDIDVDEWLRTPESDWTFELEEVEPSDYPGTRIIVEDLNDGIGRRFANRPFEKSLVRSLERDYAMILDDGFTIRVNDREVPPFAYNFRLGDSIKPVHFEYDDESDVKVEITAGMIEPPPDDVGAEFFETARNTVDYYGWFVVCNDRVVLDADITKKTIWGTDNFPKWHQQYNGFMGIISFSAEDPSKLPWTTTKRDVDEESGVYRRALVRMRKVTRPYIDYTQARKKNREKAREEENSASSIAMVDLPKNDKMELPDIEEEPKVKMVNVLYKKPKDLVKRVAKALGIPSASNAEVGRRTFDFFVEIEEID